MPEWDSLRGKAGQVCEHLPPCAQGGIGRLVRGTPNPNGARAAQLFLYAGDATAGPIEVLSGEGVAVPPPLPGLDEMPFRLTILHVNDLHGHLSRLTPGRDLPVFSRMASRLRAVRSGEDARHTTLFLSAGDDMVGTLFDELLGDGPESYGVHAGYRLYSAAGLDAAALGNHDFDLGSRMLAQAVERDARFPVLSANLEAGPPLSGRVFPAALLVVKGLRVALVGLTTRAQVRQVRGSQFRMIHPVTALQNLMPALRPLCDVLIVLSHLGRSLSATTALTRDAGDLELASSLPYGSVDLIVGGHSHDALNESGLSACNLVNGIPIVQAGAMGRFLGEVEIAVGRRASVTGARLIPTADLPADEQLECEQIRPLVHRARSISSQVLGRVANHPDLGSEAVQGRFAAGESALANLISDALVEQCRAAGHAVDLAAVDVSCVQSGLPVGRELTFGDWFELMPYADTIRIHRLAGRQLAALLDDNARRADLPGEPHVERGFLHFSRQVRYTIELGRDRATAHAVDATVDGLDLDRQSERTFAVACPSFLRGPAAAWEREAGYPLACGGTEVGALGYEYADTGLFVRQALVAHLRQHGGATEEAGARRDGRARVTGPLRTRRVSRTEKAGT